MSVELAVTLEGAPQLQAAVDTIDVAYTKLRPILQQVADTVPGMVTRAYQQQGPGWKPLSPAYAQWKAKHYPGRGLLERTGFMKAQATGQGWRVQLSDLSLTMTLPTVPYVRYHMQGSGRLPARPLLQYTQADLASWRFLLVGYIRNHAQAAGFTVKEAA